MTKGKKKMNEPIDFLEFFIPISLIVALGLFIIEKVPLY